MARSLTIFVFSLLMLSNIGAFGDDDTKLNTVTLKENGRHESGGIVMNIPRTCTYNSYRYEIDMHGQLFFKESATCQGDNGQQLGSMDEKLLVCQLDPELHCKSIMKRFTNLSFAASEQGISANNAITPWENSQQAVQLLPTIKSGAERNTKALETLNRGLEANMCPVVFGRFVIQFKRNGKISSDSNADTLMKSCIQKFQDICGNPQSKTQFVAMAAASKENGDINSQDIDNFCGTVKPN